MSVEEQVTQAFTCFTSDRAALSSDSGGSIIRLPSKYLLAQCQLCSRSFQPACDN